MLFEKMLTPIPGCFEILPKLHADTRGTLLKTYHQKSFEEFGLPTSWAEQFYSLSYRGVMRGLHFQIPPKDHAKLVHCSLGEVWDVVLDLRKGSPTFKQSWNTIISSARGNMLYLPSGVAHGFLTISSKALMNYSTTSMHSDTHEGGIRWDSAEILWPQNIIHISPRDLLLPRLEDFNSPFSFNYESGA